MPINNLIQLRKGTESQWNSANPVLASGEAGYDLTNKVLKIGDGITAWNNLTNHKHSSSNITDFNSSVSGLLPVKDINGSGYINISNSSGNYTISVSGLQPSGNYANSIHSHGNLTSSGTIIGGDPINYNHILIGTDGQIFANTTAYNSQRLYDGADAQWVLEMVDQTVKWSGWSGYPDLFRQSISAAPLSHSHTSINITDFNSSVSGLLPVKNINGSEYVNVSSSSGNFIVSITGLQPSGNYSLVGHNHTSSEITDFNSSVSGLLPTISNSGDNRLLTSTGSSVGINAENNLTFDGSLLNIIGSGVFASGLYVNSESNIKIGSIGSLVIDNGTLLIKQGAYTILAADDVALYDLNGLNSISWHQRVLHDNIGNIALDWSTPDKIGVNLPSDQLAQYTLDVNGSGNFGSGLYVNNIPVSISGHSHTSSDISDFNSAVSGLIPVKDLTAGTGIGISSISGIYTINSTGSGILADQAASLVTTVFNKTGSPIPKMTAVYINGGQGDMPTVSLAIATSDMTSAGTYGLTYETISNMTSGKVIVFGALTGLDTDQFNPTAPHGNVNGQVLYLSPSVSGSLTLTKPSAPNHIVAIGTIIRTHQNEGVIEVRVQNGFELEELHNVAISGVTNGQFLQYNSGSGLWIPSSSGNFSTLLVNGTGVSLNDHTHTASNITDFNSSVSGLLPVTNITGGNNITVSQSGTVFNVAVTGSLGLTTEEVDDRVASLLVAGSGINLTYDDPNNLLTVSVSGLTSSAIIGNGSGNVISYNLNEALNVVGSGSTTVTYNDSTNTINIGSPSLIREYELISSTKSAFSVTGGYALNNLDVYHNGIKLLASGDYTATNGSSFTLVQPAVSGDVVEWLGYSIVPRHQLILGEVRSDTVGNINYLGRAGAGSSEASGVWTIKRYTVADNGIDILTATASNVSWTNRLSASYI